jgi:FkbM family methyltransferase
MNWRYTLGRTSTRLRRWLLSRPWFPLTHAIPYGNDWAYDVARFAHSRDLRTIVDVGANVGHTAQHCRRFFPRATIHCFEPVPETVARLQHAVNHDSSIHLHAVALSDRIGSASIAVGRDSELATIVATPVDSGCMVPTDTLDHFAQTAGLNSIDLLKIDVEGHELAVLAGATELFAARRITAIYVEACLESSDHTHTHFSAIHAVLERHGFFCAGLYEPWRYPGARYRIGFANFLYWHSSAGAPRPS